MDQPEWVGDTSVAPPGPSSNRRDSSVWVPPRPGWWVPGKVGRCSSSRSMTSAESLHRYLGEVSTSASPSRSKKLPTPYTLRPARATRDECYRESPRKRGPGTGTVTLKASDGAGSGCTTGGAASEKRLLISDDFTGWKQSLWSVPPAYLQTGRVAGWRVADSGVVGVFKCERPHRRVGPFVEWLSGGVLLSHTLSGAVPSALWVLASGFGMEPAFPPRCDRRNPLTRPHACVVGWEVFVVTTVKQIIPVLCCVFWFRCWLGTAS